MGVHNSKHELIGTRKIKIHKRKQIPKNTMKQYGNGQVFYSTLYNDIISKIKTAMKSPYNQTYKFRVAFLLKNYLSLEQCDWVFRNPIEFEKIINYELKKEGWDSKSWITYGNRNGKQLYFKPHHYDKMRYKTTLYPRSRFFKENTIAIKAETKRFCYVDLRKRK
jgi:hypothetical protein